MRLFGILTVCLMLVAVLTFGFDRRYEIADRVTDGIEGLLLSDEALIDAEAEGLLPENLGRPTAVISMREAGTLNAMVGIPAFSRVHFDMPQSVTASSGEIVLEVAGSLDDEADAVLRVSVNGARRSAVLLERGELNRRLVLPLNTRELAAEVLTVSLAVDGQMPAAICTTDAVGGAVVQVLPTSHLNLQVSEPITDPSDRLLLAGAPARVTWPLESAEDQELVLTTAYGLTRNLRDILFAGAFSDYPALSFDDVAALAAELPVSRDADMPDLADLAATLGQRRAQTFATEARWRMNFEASTLPGQARAIDLALNYTSAAEQDAPWLVSVFLNDRLIHAHRTQNGSGTFDRAVPLPQDILRGNNVLTVTFQSSQHQPGTCREGVATVADLGVARLITAGAPSEVPFDGLGQILANGANLEIPTALTVYEAQVSLDTLAALADHGIGSDFHVAHNDVAHDDANATIAVLAVEELGAYLDTRDETVWLAFQAVEENRAIEIHAIAPGEAVVTDDMPRSVLAISAAQESGS